MAKIKILITGGAGYIGSTVSSRLDAEGFECLILDNLSTGFRDAVKAGRLLVGDLLDQPFLDSIFQKEKIEAVIHLAAKTDVAESVYNPAFYYEQNVLTTYSLLQSMLKAGVNKLIFSSSAAVYGTPSQATVDENSLISPINPYGNTKAICENLLNDYRKAYGCFTCALRYFNAAGGTLKCFKTHHLIPLILDSIEQNSILPVYGTDYPTRDGTAIRDYVHIADLAEAHCLVLKKMFNDTPSHCYNLGSGTGFTVREVIRAVEEVTGRTVQTLEAPRRAGDPPMLLADASKAHVELQWRPRYNLHQMIEDAWKTR